MLGSEQTGSSPSELFRVGSGSSPASSVIINVEKPVTRSCFATWGGYQHLAMGTGHAATL